MQTDLASSPVEAALARRLNEILINVLVGVGIVGGAVAGGYINQFESLEADVFGLWLTVSLPFLLAGLLASLYVRPSIMRLALAALIFGAPTVAAAVYVHSQAASADEVTRPVSLWSEHVGAVGVAVLASSATFAWLVLRGRPRARLRVALASLPVAFMFGLSFSGLGDEALGSYFLLALTTVPAVCVTLLAGIGLAPPRPPKPARAANPVTVAERPVLYTADGQRVVVVSTNGMAIASLVLGLTSGAITGLPAVITGHIARAQIRRTGQAGDGMAIAGLIMGYIVLALDLAGLAYIIAVLA